MHTRLATSQWTFVCSCGNWFTSALERSLVDLKWISVWARTQLSRVNEDQLSIWSFCEFQQKRFLGLCTSPASVPISLLSFCSMLTRSFMHYNRTIGWDENSNVPPPHGMKAVGHIPLRCHNCSIQFVPEDFMMSDTGGMGRTSRYQCGHKVLVLS